MKTKYLYTALSFMSIAAMACICFGTGAPTAAPIVVTATGAPPAVAASPTTAGAVATSPTTTAAARPSATATTAPPTATATTAPPTTAPTLTPTVAPTKLEKTSWQADFAFIGGSRRLQASFTQTGGVLSGSNRDNNAEVDIVTSGTVTGNTAVVKFTLSNGGSPRGEVTCTGRIAGTPQTISGTFTAPTTQGVGATSGNCTFR